MTTLAQAQTPAQVCAYLAIVLFTWGGLALLFGIAIGRSIRDRREQPEEAADTPPTVVELGTRLDVRA